jgi:SAM-dependent methyltransferase
MSPELAGATNYYRWTLTRIEPHLGRRILDIGGGFGSHLEPILATGRQVTSIDRSTEAVEWMRTRFAGRPGFRALCADFDAEATLRELRTQEFDTVLCLNVLEHIADDRRALRGMRAILASRGSNLVLQVPAHRWLYGRLDSLAGHHRRYVAADLARLLVEAGFPQPRVAHFNRFGVLPWFVNGRLLKPGRIDSEAVGAQVRVFDRYLVPLARAFELLFPIPIGQSLIAIAPSPGGDPC